MALVLGEVERTKVVDQANVVALHDDAGRDENTPQDGLGVQADALHEGHALLLVRGRLCIVDELVLGLETGHVIVAMAIVGGRGRCRCCWRDIDRLSGLHGG